MRLLQTSRSVYPSLKVVAIVDIYLHCRLHILVSAIPTELVALASRLSLTSAKLLTSPRPAFACGYMNTASRTSTVTSLPALIPPHGGCSQVPSTHALARRHRGVSVGNLATVGEIGGPVWELGFKEEANFAVPVLDLGQTVKVIIEFGICSSDIRQCTLHSAAGWRT